jgi:hypothetical protein
MIDPGNSQEQKEVDEVVVAEQQESSEEPQHQETQQTDEETKQVAMGEIQEATVSDETPVQPGKKRVKKVRQMTEAELMPRPSLWPLALSISVAVALGGFAFNLVLLGVGVIMVIASVIGWSLERR